MTILPEHAEASVDKKKILSVPMRFVRTNRDVGKELHPKSRVVRLRISLCSLQRWSGAAAFGQGSTSMSRPPP